MAKLANRAKMTISSTGTGNITLAAADTGYQTFAQAGISDGDVIRYIVEDASNAWEIGTAVVSNNSTVLARTVEESSAANNAALNLTSSAKVFVGVTAKDLDNAAPIFTTTPSTKVTLENDGSTAVTLNGQAYDEGGIPLSYSWDAWASGGSTIYDASSLPPQLASAPSINQSTGVFSLVGSSNTANAGTVNFRVKASDGVKVATHVASVTLSFMPQTSNIIGRWDIGDSSSYSGSGTTWTDLSGNGNTLTIGSGGSYNTTSGGGSDAGYGFAASSTTIPFGSILDSAKTVAVILSDLGGSIILFADGSQLDWNGLVRNGTGTWGSHQSGSYPTYGSPAWSGLTPSFFVNGNSVTTRQAAWNNIESSKFNSLVIRGIDINTNTSYLGYTINNHNYQSTHNLRSIIAWDVVLSDAEVKEVHNYYPSMATWDGP